MQITTYQKKCQWVKKHNMLINTWSFYINTQPFNGRWSGTTRVGRYQKKLTLSHPSWSSDILYQHPPFTTIHSILCVQFTCLTVLFDSLSRSSLVFLLVLGPLDENSMHFFTQSLSSFRRSFYTKVTENFFPIVLRSISLRDMRVS